MVYPVRSPDKAERTTLAVILLGLFGLPLLGLTMLGCESTPAREIAIDDPRLAEREGLLYLDDLPYSGQIVTLYPDRTIARREGYRDGRRDDTAWVFGASGQLLEERVYRDGRKIARHRGWYEDGSRRFDYTFVDDRHEGSAREWYPDGRLYRNFTYVAGHEEGRQVMYDEAGIMRANYVVRNGRRYGSIGTKPCR